MNDLKDDIYRGVGRVILDFGPLEIVAHRVAWTGLDPLDEAAGRAQTKPLQLSGVLRLIRKCAVDGNYERFDPGCNPRVLSFVNGCKGVADERGRLAHSFLDGNRLGNIRDAVKGSKISQPMIGFTSPVDLDRIRALPDEFYRLRDEGLVIWQRIDAAAHDPR